MPAFITTIIAWKFSIWFGGVAINLGESSRWHPNPDCNRKASLGGLDPSDPSAPLATGTSSAASSEHTLLRNDARISGIEKC